MAFEVELKAHVSEPLVLKARIEEIRGISVALCELKQDTYFSRPGEEALFRMRAEHSGPCFEQMQGTLVFTHKNKALKGGVEVNEEVEFFSSSDQEDSALAFFLSLGYVVCITKTKKGHRYTCPANPALPPLTIELVEVIGLGWFLEIEFVLEEKERSDQAKDALLAFLALVGIEKTAIEGQYYMQMLKKKKPEA
ncbi:MAG: CYTH domain-containing protein [Sphaerochaeta sp.]|nr:CYTH domain-containing protein [Sphaerochaeta sp.]